LELVNFEPDIKHLLLLTGSPHAGQKAKTFCPAFFFEIRNKRKIRNITKFYHQLFSFILYFSYGSYSQKKLVLANVRCATDCQAVTSAQADNWIAKTHWQNQSALRFGRFGFANACSAPLFSSCFARRKHNRPAVGCPPYVDDAYSDPILAFALSGR
jgi:hypothetical protein